VEIQYLSADKNYERDIAVWQDQASLTAGDPVKKQSFSLFGITRTSQALRMAKYFGLVSKYCTRTISHKTGIDGVAVTPGDVYSFAHDVPLWSESGRVISGTITSVTLDKPITLVAGKVYEIKVRFGDDTMETRTVVTSFPASESTIYTSTPFTQIPQRYDIWAVGEQNLTTKSFRLISAKRDNKDEVSLIGLEYNMLVYWPVFLV
jgi:predicted phage tail protein